MDLRDKIVKLIDEGAADEQSNSTTNKRDDESVTELKEDNENIEDLNQLLQTDKKLRSRSDVD